MRLLIFLAALIVWSAHARAEPADPTPRIAILSAFAPEWLALRNHTEGGQSHHINGVEFVTGRIAGKDVVLFLSGISMVNAAMTTQLAFERFTVCLLYTSPSPRDRQKSRMPSSA